ncbi:MBL fold metallo-hydrolase [Actinokineospora guangxiensis]|uniref:MBL fold metallo-hydrolase n=1 Tax=Actinokineospora guangxiensis TaxID=1490288 RepID=A0ABW0EUC5_9PSEU
MDTHTDEAARVGAALDEAALVEIADGVHAWVQPDGTWWINNAGVVHGRDGVALIDTCATRRRTERFLAAVRAVAGAATIRYAVNTHLHGDHCYGNALLPAETTVIGHAKTREGLLDDILLAGGAPPIWAPMPDFGVAAVRPPTVIVGDKLTVHLGEHRVELAHPGHPAHTEGDVVAWLPDSGVLFAGDLLFHGITPMVLMGSIDGALRSLDWLAAFEAEVVVPGHGPLIHDLAPVLAAHERYYRFVKATAEAAMMEDKTPLRAATSADLGEFAAWPDAERIVLNLHRAYAEARGATIDIIAAMTDAVTWNGGPLHCSV